MLPHLRSNAVAYLALFVALGGTSWAATQLPKDSVGSKQLRKNAVTGSDLAAASVQSRAIKNGTITAADLAKGLSVAGQAGATGPAGATGARGPQGEAGAKGELGSKGDTGAPGKDGADGETGPAGPTEGTSTDVFTASGTPLTPDTTVDESSVTTTRAGRLLVSKTLMSLQVTCSGGVTWRAWLTLAGVRVPGTVLSGIPSGTVLRPLTLTGVTAGAVAAGSYEGAVAVACDGASTPSQTHFGSDNLTAVVLG